MQRTKYLPRDLRRARLLAARQYVAGTACWKAILQGSWDRGERVRVFMP